MIKNPTLNKESIEIKRALISVYDKTGLVDLSKKLIARGIEILSTGGTANVLKRANIPTIDVRQMHKIII